MSITQNILYLTDSDVQQTLAVGEAVDLAEKGIKADAAGLVVGNKFYMNVGEAGFIKPFAGYLTGEELAFVKTFSYFPGNPAKLGAGTTSSMVLLFDARTGFPVCIMDGGWVTALKTGASTTVTATYLAVPDASTVVIFGAGTLGRMHLRALTTRFSLRHAYILDILPSAAEDYAAELSLEFDLAIEAVALGERERVVRQADIIITVTTGDMPLIERAWLRPGSFVARLGSYQEVAPEVITGVDKVIVDSWAYVHPRIPELTMLAADGRFGREDVYAEWPEVVGQRIPGRESRDEVITYIALGIWGEYAAILPHVYRCAAARGLGRILG